MCAGPCASACAALKLICEHPCLRMTNKLGRLQKMKFTAKDGLMIILTLLVFMLYFLLRLGYPTGGPFHHLRPGLAT